MYKNIRLKDIVSITGASIFSGEVNGPVKGISIDTRTLREGEVFLAVKGKNFNGHDFLSEAAGRGCAAVIVDCESSGNPAGLGVPVLRVGDTLKAMADIAARFRSMADIPVLAVTGTNGKTTVKDMAAACISGEFKVLKSRDSYNNIIGLSLTLFELSREYEAAVVEMGTNHPGEIDGLGAIASPTCAAITNIGDGHLEFFGDRKGVLREKRRIFDHIRPGGRKFVNGDDELLFEYASSEKGVETFGFREGCDHVISLIDITDDLSAFCVDGIEYTVNAGGRHNVLNASAAVLMALDCGVPREKIKEGLRCALLPDMRLQKIEAGNIVFINDAYNANPSSFVAAADYLSDMSVKTTKCLIAGDMLELGPGAEAFHHTAGAAAAARKIDLLITMGRYAGAFAHGARGNGMPTEKVLLAADHRQA
ncbi:MAG: UDP-N-acetylmuramoyl-tripeptide--D-alanyl-D-alanine ligase, partial [Candidatus Omnitrophica bacterium]|nr:UDP-N-acetylmuramoyl-tripeptide--D-alanyl-D-alanine ligase [Candidatus Omnitrophota bacterium]